MTTKKMLLMVGGVVVALGLLAVCFAGAVAGIVLYSLNHSEAAARGRDYLRNNAKLQADIGPVKRLWQHRHRQYKFWWEHGGGYTAL